MKKESKVKRFFKEHWGDVVAVAAGVTGAAFVVITAGAIVIKARKPKIRTTTVSGTDGLTLGDLGKLGEAIMKTSPEIDPGTKVIDWRIRT